MLLKNRIQSLTSFNPKDSADTKLELFNKAVGEGFIYTKHNTPVILALIDYFNGVKGVMIGKKELSLKKGVMLFGGYGCGKTTMFAAIKEYLNLIATMNDGKHPNAFRTTSIEEMLFKFTNSPKEIESLTYNVDRTLHINKKSPANVLVNEFCSESGGVKVYGNSFKDYMDTYYMQRYEIFQLNHKVTHGTTNYDIAEIKKMFSEKLYDRFKEMFNFVHLEGDSFRK